MTSPTAKELLMAAEAAERAANAATQQEERRAVLGVLAHKETIQLGMMAAKMQRSAGARAAERLPVREDGDDVGRVEARIPKELFFHLMQQKNFGYEGFTDNGGMKDFLKTYPQCAVKTVSGKFTVPVAWRGGRSRSVGVNFAPGTLNLAT